MTYIEIEFTCKIFVQKFDILPLTKLQHFEKWSKIGKFGEIEIFFNHDYKNWYNLL